MNKDSDPKTKEDPNNDGDLHLQTLKMVFENQQKMLEMVLGNTKERNSGISSREFINVMFFGFACFCRGNFEKWTVIRQHVFEFG